MTRMGASCLRARLGIILFSLKLQSGYYVDAFLPRPLHHHLNNHIVRRTRTRGYHAASDNNGDELLPTPEFTNDQPSFSSENVLGTANDNTISRLKGVKSVFKSAASNVSTVVRKGKSDVSSIARAAPSGLASVAERGSSDVLSLAGSAKSSINKVTEKGRNDLKVNSLRAKELAQSGARITLSLAEKGGSNVGEVASWIDSQAKSGTQMVGSTAKSLVLNFTGKESYNFGDVTKELIHRIASQKVNIQDTILVIKILIAVGASFAPLAKALPFTVLLNALNVSIEQKVGSEILKALALALDERLVAAFTSDDKSRIGDAVKQSLLTGILAFTGKSRYESGDIQRVIQAELDNETEDDDNTRKQLELRLGLEFEEWDQQFLEACYEPDDNGINSLLEDISLSEDATKTMDMKIALALEECEAISRRKGTTFWR